MSVTPKLTTLELGDPIPENATPTGVSVLVSPSQLLPEYTWIDDGIEYSLAVNRQGRIQYIATSSLQAHTPDGVGIGQPLKEVLNSQHLEVRKWLGWGYVVELPSGWKVALFLDGYFLEREPVGTDTVDLLFK